MNLFILLLVILLNNASFGSIVPDGTTNCVQNATLAGECETCLCNSNGNATLCKSSCDNSTVVNGGNNNETHIEQNQVCPPNEVRTEDCKRCKCAANGIAWFCTPRACPPQRRRRSSSSSSCTRGTSWNDGCNTCFCTEFGVARCTRRHCERKERSVRGERQCTPGHQWKNDCNDCFCTETGIAACTLRGCLSNVRGPPQINIVHFIRNHTHTGGHGSQSRKNDEST